MTPSPMAARVIWARSFSLRRRERSGGAAPKMAGHHQQQADQAGREKVGDGQGNLT
jgi:hypothetical protein